jgi:hypothetical protein
MLAAVFFGPAQIVSVRADTVAPSAVQIASAGAHVQPTSTLINFDSHGAQLTRFDSIAAAIDAHDGEISFFNGTFYLYGTSYDCGYEWGNPQASFCGFKVYSSMDLVNWTDRGFLYDAQTALWQSRCNGGTYGCYRPHVVYNAKNKVYVLWINVYDNRVGYRVFVSPAPTGPFAEIAEPTLAVNGNAPVAGLNNGDHDVFVDDDGTAYVAYTDWRSGGAITVEKLNEDYTSGTGQCVKVTPGATEAPALMKRNGKYYLLYSDPNCGYCGGTGTSYRTASSLLGPWSEGIKISTNSCGGQPSFVSTIKLNGETIFLYGSDLWNNGAKNEALANFYWAPLTFAADGSINPIPCQDRVSVLLKPDPAAPPVSADLDNTAGADGFKTYCDLGGNVQRSQSFVANRTGRLTGVSLCLFKNAYPDAGLVVQLYAANDGILPGTNVLSSVVVLPESMGWSPRPLTINPNVPVEAGRRYLLVLKSASSKGRYGFEYSDQAPCPRAWETYSSDGGQTFAMETNRCLLFRTFVHAN